MTKEELMQIPTIEHNIKIQQQELQRLEEMMEGLQGYSTDEKVQTTKKQDKMADAVAAKVDLEVLILEDIARLLRLMIEAKKLLTKLDGEDRILMELYYIRGYSWAAVAAELEYSYEWTVKKHGKILQELFG